MKPFLSLLLVFATVSELHAAAVCPKPNKDCKLNSVSSLCQFDPDDYAVFNFVQANRDFKNTFFSWYVDCKHDALSDLTTAVHESTHMMTEGEAAYPLIDGRALPRPICDGLAPKMLKPKTIGRQFDRTDSYVQIYLLGDAASADDFCFLLDEMNAYTRGLNVSVKLKDHVSVLPDPVDHRAGLLALMSFLKTYADSAQNSSPKTWAALQGPLKSTIQILWAQANDVLKDSCRVENWGGQYFFDKLCASAQMAGIYAITHEAPSACDPTLRCRPKAL